MQYQCQAIYQRSTEFASYFSMMKKERHLDESLRDSYFAILAVFTADPTTTPVQMNGIRNWGQQLAIEEEVIKNVILNPQQFYKSNTPQLSIEQLYNLVYMIYLDEVIEDCEIEILMKYAEHLGFPKHIVGDLMKALLTAPSDGISAWQVKDELKDLLSVHLS